MDLEIIPAKEEDKSVLRRLMELYLYDFSEMDGADVNEAGLFEYDYLDHYWTEEGRHPFLVRVDGKLAGFVLVRQSESRVPGEPEGQVHQIAEFFVMRKYRRKGVGKRLACEIFDRFRGRWEVDEIPENLAAQAFWRRVIGEYTGGKYRELWPNIDEFEGPVQLFDNYP